jgi:hypothetical protein
MTNKSRTQITIHTRQRIVVHALPDSLKAWCEHCHEIVVALTPQYVGLALRLTAGALAELLDAGKFHTVEPATKSPLVCANSLSCETTENEILIAGENQ